MRLVQCNKVDTTDNIQYLSNRKWRIAILSGNVDVLHKWAVIGSGVGGCVGVGGV